MFERRDEFLSLLLGRDVFWLLEGIYPKRPILSGELAVDLLHHLIYDLEVPLRPGAKVVVQHPVLPGEVQELFAEVLVRRGKAAPLGAIFDGRHCFAPRQSLKTKPTILAARRSAPNLFCSLRGSGSEAALPCRKCL